MDNIYVTNKQYTMSNKFKLHNQISLILFNKYYTQLNSHQIILKNIYLKQLLK